MGDRELGLWIGNHETDNLMAFATYSYSDLTGNGNSNYWKGIAYENDLTEWHYVYFGYSRKLREAYAYVEFHHRAAELTFSNVNHFLSATHYLFVG